MRSLCFPRHPAVAYLHLVRPMSVRMRVMRFFLWASVLGWGIGLGAKLFDLIVVAGAWSASLPASFALLPYGPRFPINPGRLLPAIVRCYGARHSWRPDQRLA